MNLLKRSKRIYIIVSVVTLVLGMFMILFPKASVYAVCYILGGIALFAGISKLIEYFSRNVELPVWRSGLVSGILCLIFGVIFLVHPQRIISSLHFILGIVILLDSAMKLQNSRDSKAANAKNWWITMVLSIAGLIIGILMVVLPVKGAYAMTILLGVAMVISGTTGLIFALRVLMQIKKDAADSPIDVDYIEIDPKN